MFHGWVQRGGKAVREAGQPASMADDTPSRRRHDDVDTVAAEPGALVEAILRRTV